MTTHRSSSRPTDQTNPATASVRLDKWLWAARFFKTRSQAKEAIEGGKVHFNRQRMKVSKEVHVGMMLTIRQGFDDRTVIIRGLSEARGNATTAQLLYEETPESLAQRQVYIERRKLYAMTIPDERPTKRDRRQIHRFEKRQENSAPEPIPYDLDSDDEGF